MSYDDLMRFVRTTYALEEVAGRTGWDQETQMPSGAAPQRAEEMAALEEVLHSRRTDPRLGDWLGDVEPADEVQAANLRDLRRRYARDTRVPADLAAEIARCTSASHRAWVSAKAADDFASFAPVLERVVDLRRQEGQAIADDGADPYDALLQDYEPGMSSAWIAEIFDALRPGIVELRDAVLDRPSPAPLSGAFDSKAQLALSEKIARLFGYDMDHGRMDLAAHPFSSGSGLDVRITTRVDEADPLGCLLSTIHEVGHACYEQGIDDQHLLTPLGHGVSMGVHESQSRIYENQLGRSASFAQALYPMMRDAFGDLGVDGPAELYAAMNRVEQGFIRTEAEELSYNLHVFMRFDLEQALIRGDLAVRDLEAAWNDRFKADFGLEVPKASLGVLQDVHWAAGLLGYFPTYSLGNVYSACLMEAMQRDLPDLDTALAAGDLAPATGWLRGKIHQYGGLYEAEDLITRACGTAPSPAPLLRYLTQKFSGLYGL